MIPWILIAVAIALVIGIILAVIASKGKKTPPDYYSWYIMGIIWFIFGILMEQWAFSVMGLVFSVIALHHKNEWKKNHEQVLKLTPRKRMYRMIIIGALIALLLAYLIVLLLYR